MEKSCESEPARHGEQGWQAFSEGNTALQRPGGVEFLLNASSLSPPGLVCTTLYLFLFFRKITAKMPGKEIQWRLRQTKMRGFDFKRPLLKILGAVLGRRKLTSDGRGVTLECRKSLGSTLDNQNKRWLIKWNSNSSNKPSIVWHWSGNLLISVNQEYEYETACKPLRK